MEREINFGIGFVTGRSNVCKVINSYYNDVLRQIEEYHRKVNITFFILYDLSYQYTKRTDFYNIIPDLYRKNINVRYITPEEIESEKDILSEKYNLSKDDVELFIGHGHAKGRNTVMYYALKEKMDYLLFWDDDEYPVACIKGEDGKVEWKKQNNVIDHIRYMEKEDANVTRAYHCGYISPIPYIEESDEVPEEDLKNFIEAISNELVTWESIKKNFEEDGGVTFADRDIANGEGAFEILAENGEKKWVAGSTLCLNLKDIEKIPAFYNPPGARGEDTFFSMSLDEAKVFRIPLYHFHDGFLKCTSIMKNRFPSKLRKIESDENSIEQRFLKASIGWIKYKPLLMYIENPETYKERIEKVQEKLEKGSEKINKLFENSDFTHLPEIMKEYDENVEEHYQEFLDTNKIWDKLKVAVKQECEN